MNRPIKFRAWDKYNKSMIKPCLTEWIDFEGNCYFEPAKKYNTPNTEIYPTDDYILMQFTGLHDKNGKEIYEGDIFKLDILGTAEEYNPPEALRHVVEFNNGSFGYRPLFPNLVHDDDQFWDTQDEEVVNSEYIEIIGNIYENPELIPEG